QYASSAARRANGRCARPAAGSRNWRPPVLGGARLEHGGPGRAGAGGPDGVREVAMRWNGEKFVVTEPEERP
ncbi:hypothetical protein, partial [Streptomyces sp. NPDC001948]